MRRLLALLTALVLLLATPALAVVDRPENGFVGDYAGVLDDELEAELVERGQALRQTTGAEIVIVSVDFMDGMDAESYAEACFNQWGIGDESRDNGLLLVFAVGENRVWAMRGAGLEKSLSASTLNGWLEDSFYDDYDAGEYDAAVRGFADEAYDWMERYYDGTGSAGGYVEDGEPAEEEGLAGPIFRFFIFTQIVVVALVLLVVIFGSGGSRYRRRYGPYRYHYPIFLGRPWGWGYRPPPPPPPGGPHPPSVGGGIFGGFHSGGSSRGGGAGRRGSGGVRTSSHSSFRSSSRSSFRSGGRSRGGGAGRR